MDRFRWKLFLVVALLAACRVRCQAQSPVVNPPNAPVIIGTISAAQPATFIETYEDRNPPGWISGIAPDTVASPFFDPRFHPPAGWFTDLALGVSAVRLTNQLNGQVQFGGVNDTVAPGAAPLNVALIPRVSIGYRFLQLGELVLSYQSIASEGRSLQADIAGTGPGILRSRVNFNVVDLDYAGSEISLLPAFDMKWRVGVRFANTFFDSTATSPTVRQQASNFTNGAGPRLGLDLARPLPAPGLALTGRLEGAFLVSHLTQNFAETKNIGGALVQGTDVTNLGTDTAMTSVLTAEAGLSYTPPIANHWLRFSAVYHFEQWWGLGDPVMRSDGELNLQGVFFRAEVSY